MVEHIEFFVRKHCFNCVSVAAVPRHGVGFWVKNGFEQYVDENGTIAIDRPSMNAHDALFLKLNMLVFLDTPLFAKFMFCAS